MRRSRQRGSVLIEATVAIPLLVACTMLIVQGIVLASGLGSLAVAAKDAARAAADSCSTLTAREAADRAVPDFVRITRVSVNRDGDDYSATVVAALQFGVPHLATGEFDVSRSATMPRLSSCH